MTNSIAHADFNNKVACNSPADAVQHIQRLFNRGESQNALTLAQDAVSVWPEDQTLLLVSSRLANRLGRPSVALNLLERAAKRGNELATQESRAIINANAPFWHFRMMNDELRNHAYDYALRQTIDSDTVVLDIGCGAGLLSMMAARAGAKHIYACEVSELMTEQARKIIEENGFATKISLINKLSNQLQVGVDLPEKADVIVAEVFDTGLLGEHAIRTFDHAREHLLKPGGVILPPRASIQAVLLESDVLHREVVTTECCGFKVDALNSLSPSYFQARIDAYPHRILSEEKTVSNYDFSRQEDVTSNRPIEFHATSAGVCHGVCFWFTLDFGPHNTLCTGPTDPWNCWMQAMSMFETPITLAADQKLKVKVEQTNSYIHFSPPKIVS